jgi:predicted TIM-barrel fold metal-dependent hydrolase
LHQNLVAGLGGASRRAAAGRRLGAAMLIVDAWIQHFSPRVLAHPMFASVRRWAGMNIPAELPFDLTLATLDAASVTHAVITAWHGPEGVLVSNDEVAAWVAQHPGRLVGLASVDLLRPLDAVRELRRAVKQLGLRGLRILPWLWGLPPNDRRYYPLYAECCELGVPFCLQVGHTGPMRSSEPGRPIPYLDDVALDFPELVIVGGHVGFPWTNEMIALATKYENVHIDTSAWKPKRFPPELVAYMRGHGRRKVLFGSNSPMLLPGACLAEVDGLGLDEEAKRLYLGENAARVFGIPR